MAATGHRGSGGRLCWGAQLAAALVGCLMQASCAAHGQPASRPATFQTQSFQPGAPAVTLTGPALRAQQQAALLADPVAARLALWLRAQVPGAASASEIDAVLHAEPDWPGRGALLAQLQPALAREPDDRIAARLCDAWQPRSLDALIRCAVAESPASLALPHTAPSATSQPSGQVVPLLPFPPTALSPALAGAARAAWTGGLDSPADAQRFLALFGQLLTPQAQRQRFERQLDQGALAAARRQLPRLPAAERPLAVARLALFAGEPGALGLARLVAGTAQTDPRLLLDEARWLRRQQRPDEALALWRGAAGRDEAGAPPALQDLFAQERVTLARDMLAAGRDGDALALARDDAPSDVALRLDIDFLVGWIELRRLHDPADAAQRFALLTRESRAPITLGRGFYWLGRSHEAEGDIAAAHLAYAQAATFPTSFYGQLASLRLQSGEEISLRSALTGLHDPTWTRQQALAFAGNELARAASLLVAWGDPHDASAFILHLDAKASDVASHAMAARFADRLGVPQAAVAITRRAALAGIVLPESGWPAPYTPPAQPALPAGLALAVMRQESGFDPAVVSPAGAHGLMQLMPATASHVAGTMQGAPGLGSQALADPQTNMRLGTLYLASLLDRFANVVPVAVAAYNAGPARVQQWLQQTPVPVVIGTAASDVTPAPNDAMIDWIELIPFGETRNYVQRVMESQTLYRMRARDIDAAELAWVQPTRGQPRWAQPQGR